MATTYLGDRRTKLRDRLASFMKKHKVSGHEISDFIKADPKVFGGVTVGTATVYRFLNAKDPRTVADIRLAVLEKYLEIMAEVAARPRKRKQAESLFLAARDFFHMRPEKADQYRDAVNGMYAFYAYSEKGQEQVCLGAIEFKVERGEFTVREEQRSIPEGGDEPHTEIFTGHYLFRGRSLIALLRDAQDKRPKFYILSIEPYPGNSKRNVVMAGALLKIGAQKDLFIGNVYMVRRATALKECRMLPRTDVSRTIRSYLDIGMWAAAPGLHAIETLVSAAG
jgi:hypothetical protein